MINKKYCNDCNKYFRPKTEGGKYCTACLKRRRMNTNAKLKEASRLEKSWNTRIENEKTLNFLKKVLLPQIEVTR